MGIKNTILCQCPQSGNPHFYVLGDDVVMGVDKPCVNALSRAILISTLTRQTYLRSRHCVNALSRAILISTIYFTDGKLDN